MSEYDLGDVPSDTDIKDKIAMFEPIFIEGYRRTIAYEAYPRAYAIMMSSEKINASRADIEMIDGVYVWYSPPGDSATQVIGCFRWSGTLRMLMPAPVPAGKIGAGAAFRAAWQVSDPGGDAAIDQQARSRTAADLTSINDSFEKVFEQCDVSSVGALLDRLTGAAQSLTDLIDRHEDREFEQVAGLFEKWEGDDADACYEVFGQRLRPAAGHHRQMLAELLRSAGGEGIAQGTAMTELFNVVALGHKKLQDHINRKDYSQAALRRLFGTFVVNRVRFLSDILAVVDFSFEIASEGQETGRAGNWLTEFLEPVFPDYPQVPTAALCNGVRDALIETAKAEFRELYDARNQLLKELDNAEADWSSMITCDIIPGYVD